MLTAYVHPHILTAFRYTEIPMHLILRKYAKLIIKCCVFCNIRKLELTCRIILLI